MLIVATTRHIPYEATIIIIPVIADVFQKAEHGLPHASARKCCSSASATRLA